jgi:hypothetical protein
MSGVDGPATTRPVGVMVLENAHLGHLADLRGALASRRTFPQGHVRTVPGAHSDIVVSADYRAVEDEYVATAKSLAAEGIDVLTADCGFSIAYQDAVAERVRPAVLSNLLLVALLTRIFGGRVGVITYDAEQLDDARRTAAGWPSDVDVPVAGLRTHPAWGRLAEDDGADLDLTAMRSELFAVVREFVDDHGLEAILLECTTTFPFADDLRREVGVAVFDLGGLVGFVAAHLPDTPRGA